MLQFNPIRNYLKNQTWNKGDVLAIFGEVFERGYVNGLIDEAKKHGLTIVYTTVGRRDANGELRALTEEEKTAKNQSPIINVPLEAGFDLEKSKSGITPVDQLKEYGLTGWEEAQLDWKAIEESKSSGTERFRNYTSKCLSELEKLVPNGKNLLIAHTMAGGFPRAKVVMPISNRIFKGSGARFQSSRIFWESDIGRLCEMSFTEVTARTFDHLLDLSSGLREKIQSQGGKVSYVAYGYHGNETLFKDKLEWFSYSPYLQGWAKCELENVSSKYWKKDVSCTVFNVPEILTNSSSIFLGIEVALYSLIRSLKKANINANITQQILKTCSEKLKDGITLEHLDQKVQEYLLNPLVKNWPKFEGWPQHNGPEQMELMKKYSSEILAMHKNEKDLLTAELSEVIFKSCGKVMFHESVNPRDAVVWVGHDLVSLVAVE